MKSKGILILATLVCSILFAGLVASIGCGCISNDTKIIQIRTTFGNNTKSVEQTINDASSGTKLPKDIVEIPAISIDSQGNIREEIPVLFNISKLEKIKEIQQKGLSEETRTSIRDLDRSRLLAYIKSHYSEHSIMEVSSSEVDTKLIGGFIIPVVEHEETQYLWHPIALVDSEPGVIHNFTLNVFINTEFKFESEVKYVGYEFEQKVTFSETYNVRHEPVSVKDGKVVTILQQFRHVYQEGTVYYVSGFIWWPIGEFKREYIDKWLPTSWKPEPTPLMSETREHFLGTWDTWPYSHSAWVTITNELTYEGSMGLSVWKEDVFGASAKINVKIEYGVEAAHWIKFTPWGPDVTLDLYGGRWFDINLQLNEPGGGCPILYVLTNSGYVSEGLLDIHVDLGMDDAFAYRILDVKPLVIHNKIFLRLVEHPKTHSFIDQVKLYAVLKDYTVIEFPLIRVVHSEDGNVLPELLHSDDIYANTLGAELNNGTSQWIDLTFVLPHHLNVAYFVFEIEGHNYLVKY